MKRKILFWSIALVLWMRGDALAQTAPSPTFGNLNVQQNDSGNTATSVTVTLSYSEAARSADGVTSLGNIGVRSGSNRGDINVSFTGTPANDRNLGIMLSYASQILRDNTAFGDTVGPQYATTATEWSSGGYYIPTFSSPEGAEFNVNVAAAWFPYADGWIGGHAVNSVNGGVLTSLIGSSGLTLSTTAPGVNTLYDPGATGVYELNLAGINSQTDGILLVSGGKNEDNYAISNANLDGTWTIRVKDNGSNTSSTEADGLAFVYIPKDSVVSGENSGIHALGRLNGNMSRAVTAGDYAMIRTGTGTYQLYAPGIDPAQAVLLLSPGPGGALDNVWFYEAESKGWRMEQLDLPGMTRQDSGATEETLSFALMAGKNTASIWKGGGVNTSWSTMGNWQGDALPSAVGDLVVRSGTGMVVDSAREAGLMLIQTDTAFNVSGSGTLTLHTGLIVNAAPTASTTYIISAPLVLAEDAFILSNSIGTSSLTVRLDVPSGNAVTSNNKNLTLGGANAIEIRDPINLGTGRLIKEGAGQTTLLTAHTHGGALIRFGPNSTTSGAFRLNAAAAYGAFGSADLVLENRSAITALYFDGAAGSGTLSNNIVLQSTTASAGVRFTLDAAATFQATLSGVISGGHEGAEVIVDNEAATGEGRLHLTNTANSFVAQRINLNRGALVIYGDGSLGAASNPLYLNTNNTTGLSTTGLHFGAENIVLGESRAITVNSNSTLNTGGFHATVAGQMSGVGGIFKAGEGVLELRGANTYEGTTTVLAGTLLLNPTLSTDTPAGTGPLVVAAGATLAGHGSVPGQVTLQNGALLAPGAVRDRASALTLSGGLTLASGSTLLFHIFGPSQYDQVLVGPAGVLEVSPEATFQLMLHHTPSHGESYTLLDWTTLSGDMDLQDNLLLPDLEAFGLEWDTSLFSTSGVILVVPEPSRGLLLIVGLGLFLLRRQRAGR